MRFINREPKRKKPIKKIKFSELLELARNVNDIDKMKSALQSLVNSAPEKAKTYGTYQNCANKMLAMLHSNYKYIPFKVFSNGNKKLSFITFSSMPIVDCYGAGACLEYCYSLKCWRNPNAFFRQLQNAILLRYARGIVTKSLMKLPESKTVRLYVDGDFYSMSCLKFWFSAMRLRKDLNFYGYSKSLHLFAAFKGAFPTNYVLNKSNGSKFDDNEKIQSIIENLPIFRGDFVAVDETSDDKKTFTCPNVCDSCLPNGKHACGMIDFKKTIQVKKH